MKIAIVLGFSVAAAAAAFLFTGCDSAPLEPACPTDTNFTPCQDEYPTTATCYNGDVYPAMPAVTGCTVGFGTMLCVPSCSAK